MELSRREKRKIRRDVFREWRKHRREHGDDCDLGECAEDVIQNYKNRHGGGEFGEIPWDTLLDFLMQLIERLCPPEPTTEPTGTGN